MKWFALVPGLLLAAFLAAPLWASEESRTSEIYAVLGALKDRLLVVYRQRSGKLDPSTKASDLFPNRDELTGSYFDASNYGMRIVSLDPPVVWLIYRKRFEFQPRARYMQLSVDTGKFDFVDEAPDFRESDFPWAPNEATDQEKIYDHWEAAATPWVATSWWLGTQIWVFVSAIFVLVLNPHHPAERRAAFAALLFSIASWAAFALIFVAETKIGPAVIVTCAFALAASLYSFIVNATQTRRSLSLSLANSFALVPAIMFFAAAVSENVFSRVGFVCTTIFSISITWLGCWVRYRWAQP